MFAAVGAVQDHAVVADSPDVRIDCRHGGQRRASALRPCRHALPSSESSTSPRAPTAT
jgi:hypothetical protein